MVLKTEHITSCWVTSCIIIVGVIAVIITECDAFKTSKGATQPPHDKAVVCYVAAWAGYRKGRGSFTLDNLDPALCTHLVYAFAGLNITTNTIQSLDPFHDLEENYEKGSYRKMTNLRARYPHLKVTLAIGGWNEGSTNYSILVSSPQRRQVFVHSVVDFLGKYGFDGLDLDWEFPANRGGAPEDKQNFVLLVKELKEAFDKHKWLLTAALGAAEDVINTAYDVPALSQYLDYMHIMCYDYHGTWDKRTGANAPLYGTGSNDKLNVDYSIKYYLKLGANPKKLVLGVPMYGRTFFLDGKDTTDKLGDPATEDGIKGNYTQQNGFMGYNEICEEIGKNNKMWNLHWDEQSLTPFAVSGNKVISYDDEHSITEKVKYAVRQNLAGIMVWSVDTDDFHGDCRTYEQDENAIVVNYPLMGTINKAVVESLQDIQNEVVTQEEKDFNKDKNEHKSNSCDGLHSQSTILFLSAFVIFIFKV